MSKSTTMRTLMETIETMETTDLKEWRIVDAIHDMVDFIKTNPGHNEKAYISKFMKDWSTNDKHIEQMFIWGTNGTISDAISNPDNIQFKTKFAEDGTLGEYGFNSFSVTSEALKDAYAFITQPLRMYGDEAVYSSKDFNKVTELLRGAMNDMGIMIEDDIL